MNKLIIFIAVVIVGVLSFLWLQSDEVVDEERIETVEEMVEDGLMANEEVEEVVAEADVVIDMSATHRVFIVDGEENPVIRVNQGDIVELNFEVTGGNHDFVIDELRVATDILSTGQSQTVVFEASEAGTFEYYCSVGSHRADGMFGTFEVVAVE